MRLSQKVAFNTIVQIATKVITVFFGFFTMVILTRYLGREMYGNYMYILTLVVLFGAFADWGTATIGVREASKEKEKQDKILVNVFLLRLFLSLGASVLMIIAAFLMPLKIADPLNELMLRQGIIIGSLILILSAIKASFGIVFQTRLEMQKYAVGDIIASILIFVISFLLVRFNFGLIPLIGAVLIAYLGAISVLSFLVSKTIKFKLNWDKVFIKKFIKESLPMGAILLMFTVDNKIDTVMLGSLKGSGAVGIYSVSYRIYDVLILGAAYFMNSLLPVLSQYSDLKKWRKKLRVIYQKSFDILLMMGGFVIVLVLVLSPLIIKLITQNRFQEFFDSVLVLRILSLAIFLSYFNHLTGYTIVALGRQRLYFSVAISALVFNVLVNLLVIPRFSYYGAATVTVLTEALVLFITSFFTFRLLKIVPSFFHFPKTLLQLIKQKGKILND